MNCCGLNVVFVFYRVVQAVQRRFLVVAIADRITQALQSEHDLLRGRIVAGLSVVA